MPGNTLSYIILNYNDSETTIKCINKIKDYKILDHIVVVDNCSPDGSYEKLQYLQSERIDVIRSDKNGGYGYGNNYGARYVAERFHSQYIIIGNPDAFIEEKDIIECLNFISSKEDCACVVPLMKDKDFKTNYRCVWRIPTYFEYCTFPLLIGNKIDFCYPERNITSSTPLLCECVAGSWLMLNAAVFKNIGMYDENIFLYCEEVVLGIKIKQYGMNSYLLPTSSFQHLHGVSVKKTFQSSITTSKIMWKSRLYVLDTYYRGTPLQKVYSRLCRFLGLTEKYVSELKNKNK
ncbi:MAG: glycosyltransferase family 2 protein [Candidatus Methanofastidiosa archaeon]|nr:glycosyltransferase family 2 protein [Candidatus Methanofastidiosa archaeon]